jgi:hypothetical protein
MGCYGWKAASIGHPARHEIGLCYRDTGDFCPVEDATEEPHFQYIVVPAGAAQSAYLARAWVDDISKWTFHLDKPLAINGRLTSWAITTADGGLPSFTDIVANLNGSDVITTYPINLVHQNQGRATSTPQARAFYGTIGHQVYTTQESFQKSGQEIVPVENQGNLVDPPMVKETKSTDQVENEPGIEPFIHETSAQGMTVINGGP